MWRLPPRTKFEHANLGIGSNIGANYTRGKKPA